jgi:predicted ester cyclase
MAASAWTPGTDTAGTNIAIVQRVMNEGFNQGSLAVCDELYSPDAVEHQRGNQSGADGVKAVISTLRRWFSDFRIEIEDVIAEDDMVWFRNRATGTNDGHFMGFPPTGRKIDIIVYDTVRIKDGRIVEHWGVPDQFGAVLQLGLFTPPGGRPPQAGTATGERP